MGVGMNVNITNPQMVSFGNCTTAPRKAEIRRSVTTAQGNQCTDGKDDGKISLDSKLANAVQGIGKGAINCVKGMFMKGNKFSITQTAKTVAMAGLCFVPIVGKIAALGMAGYGAINGATSIVRAGVKAANAKTDGEAKDAWENIGSSSLTTVLSVGAIKASFNGLKGDLSKYAKEGFSFKNKSVGEIYDKLKTDTVDNMKGAWDRVKNTKVKKIEDYFKGKKEQIKNAKNARTKKRDAAKAEAEANKGVKTEYELQQETHKDLKAKAGKKGSGVEYHKDTNTYSDGKKTYDAKTGAEITIDGNTRKSTNNLKNGTETINETFDNLAVEKPVKTGEVKIKDTTSDGIHTRLEESRKGLNGDNPTTDEVFSRTNENTNSHIKYHTEDGKRIYDEVKINDQNITNSTLLDKGVAHLDSGKFGNWANKGLGKHFANEIYGASMVLDEENANRKINMEF